MINNLKKKILPTFLSAMLLIGNIGCGIAEAKSWEMEGDPWSEGTSLQPMDFPNGGRVISVSLRNTDVQQVLRMFADKAGLNVVFAGEGVEGQVTMDLVNTTLIDALNYVTESANLTYFVDKQTLFVMNAEMAKEKHFAKKSMRIIPIKYTSASSIAKFLNTNIFGLGRPGLSSGEIVVTNPVRNEIIIFGSDSDFAMAMQIIPKLDVKPVTTTYKINHVTPKEMAMLVCDSLFQNTDGEETAYKFDGAITGAAGEPTAMSVGAGTVACKIANTVTAGSLASFAAPPITVMYNTGQGTLDIIGGSEEQIQLANEFIMMHDKKQLQAILDFVVLELNEQGSQQFENEWHFNNNVFPVSFIDGKLKLGSIIFFNRSGSTTAPNNNGGPAALWDTITWIEQTGKGKLLQKPSIVVTNGAESTIDLTQDYIEKTDSQVSESTMSETPVVTRTYTLGKTQGMKLKVTPFISTDGYVTLNIHSEYATPYQTEYGTDQLGQQYIAATLLERRNIEIKSIRVKNGETLVLGGLIYEKEVQSANKIPILADIPGLGVFFRNTKNEKQKNELVIMITPKLVTDTEDTVNI